MIDNRLEYQRMYEVERRLWWYQVLHQKVLTQISKHPLKNQADFSILDAACGTGGLLSYLNENGFRNLRGFDYSRYAIEFSRERGLNINFGDLRNVAAFEPGQTFDIVTCNDALYFLNDDEIVIALKAFRAKLKSGGMLISNIHAFEAFSGTHDLAVGSQRRFKIEQFRKYSQAAGLQITYSTYWPFALSLPILAVRQWQRMQIQKGQINPAEVDSDVKYPGDLVNSILKVVTKAESALLGSAPFGSSLFMVMKAK